MKLLIEDLYPFEPSVIRSSVSRDVESYSSVTALPAPPTVVKIDGCWVVHNGNSRVYAAKLVGLTELDVIDNTPSDQEQLAAFRSRLRRAKSAKQRGFENLPIDETVEDRYRRG